MIAVRQDCILLCDQGLVNTTCEDWITGAAIIGGTGGHVPPTFLLTLTP